MGIQATIQVIDLPKNIACQIEPEDEIGVQYATLTAPDGTEMCFDYWRGLLTVDVNAWGNNRARYLPWLDKHGIPYNEG